MANRNIRTGEYRDCRTCGEEMYLQPYQVKSGRKKYCSKQCLYKGDSYTNLFEKGHPDLVPPESRGHSEETKKKISRTQRIKNKDRVPNILKKKERDWKRDIRSSFQWKEWRKTVFERDGYTCQECEEKGVFFEPHHIIPIRSDLDKLFDINNGITLCRPCHRETFRKESKFEKRYSAIALDNLAQMSAYC